MITEHHLIWIELDTIWDLTIGKASCAFSCKNNTVTKSVHLPYTILKYFTFSNNIVNYNNMQHYAPLPQN